MKRTLLLLLIAATTITVFSQGEIPVNMYTGSPGIYVNLFTLTDHDLSESITMSYNVNSVNLNAGSAYGGWNLQVGGQISRQVKGLPDDFAGTGPDTRKGWLYNSPLQFPNSSSLNSSPCDNFQTDYDFLNNLQYKIDTEPDMFSFSVGGYSGKFVFDNAGNVQLIPYQDIRIVPTYSNFPTDKKIIAWTITTNSGIIYTLNEKSTTSRHITKNANQQYASSFDRLYNFYQTKVSYTTAWMLTTSQSPTGASITYAYKTPANGTSTVVDPWYVKLLNATGTNPAVLSLMTDSTTTTSRVAYQIKTSTGKRATCDPDNGINIYDTLASPTLYKKFMLGYTNGKLTSIQESGGQSCTLLPPYTFNYNGWTGSNISPFSQDFWGFYNGRNSAASKTTPGYFPTIYVYPNEPASERYRLYPIPSYAGTQVILGSDSVRTPHSTHILSGTLSSIIYPTGGETDFTFEINKYYDARIGKDQRGGGLRIKSITYLDKANPGANMTKNFSYQDSTGAHSSGRLFSKPTFVIPLWQQQVPTDATAGTSAHTVLYSSLSGTQPWQYLLAITNSDIGDTDDTQGSTVGYSHVTVSRPGSGKAIFDYLVPAAYGDAATGSKSTDWKPALTKFARPTTCPSLGIIPGAETYGYGLFPQVEYDYERGLIWKKTEKNETGTTVRVTTTNYQYLFKQQGVTKPDSVVCLAYDLYPDSKYVDAGNTKMIYLYAQYSLITNVAKVVASETVKTYDENNASRYSRVSTQYSYTSANHRFLNQVKTTAADGSVYGSYLKYVPDFAATSIQSDTYSNMIYMLKTANRTSTVIQQVSTRQLPNKTEEVLGASLVMFAPFTYNKPLLRYQMAYRPAAPASLSKFKYASIVSNVFHYDTIHYDTVQTVNEYDLYDIPVSAMGENKMTAGTLTGYNQRFAVAQFSQAQSANIAFSDFETTTLASFSVQNGYYGAGRTGATGVHPYAVLTRSNIVKPATATKYLLSFWSKPLAGDGSIVLVVTAKNSSGAVVSTVTYPQYNYTSGNTDYQYFTQLIDVSALPSPFTIQLQWKRTSSLSFSAPTGNPSTYPLIDDVGFYPDYANLASTTYSFPFGPNSATGPSGNTVYTTYDDIGRTKWILDQDKNIRKSYTYSATGQVTTPLIASLSSVIGILKTNNSFKLVAKPNPCYTGVTYQWDLSGNGTTNYSAPVASDTSASVTFNSDGLRTFSLKVNSSTTSVTSSIALNVVTNWATLSANLSGSLDASGYLTLTATPTGTNGLPVTYQWFQRISGTTTWIPCGRNNNTFSQRIYTNLSVDFMCTVTTLDGRTTNTNIQNSDGYLP